MTAPALACTCDASKPDHVHADTCPALVTCPDCAGAGEHGYEPMDWWHGSGVNVVLTTCRTCAGTGACTAIDAAAFHAERCEHGVHEDDPAGCPTCRRAAWDARPHTDTPADPWATPTGAQGWTAEPPF